MKIISKERWNELQDKVAFVKELDKAIRSAGAYTSVTKVAYDVFATSYGIHEYVVVTYCGGAIAVTNCGGCSMSAIFRAIGKLLDGGYYNEVEIYQQKKSQMKPIEVEE